MAPLVTVVIVSWNGKELLRKCLSSFYQYTTNIPCRVVVVDNASKDGSVEMLKETYLDVHIIRNLTNTGFSIANNQGIKYALSEGSKYVLLLNNDVEITEPNWLQELLSVFDSDSKVGIVGCKLLYPNGKLQHAGGVVTLQVPYNRGEDQEDRGQYDKLEFLDYVTGAVLLIRSNVIRQIGFLDPGFTPLYCEDTDWCIRAKLYCYRIAYTPKPTLIHHCGASSSTLSKARRAFYFKRSFTRFYLLNYPLIAILKRLLLFESQEVLRCFVVKGRRTPIALRSDTASRLRVLVSAWLPSLCNIGEIVALRRQRLKYGEKLNI